MRAAAVIALVTVLVGGSSPGAQGRRPAAFPYVPLTLLTPQEEQFDLRLDEIELDWSESAPGRSSPLLPVAVVGISLLQAEPALAIFRVTGAASPAALGAVSRQLEVANPGAEANFVLYVRDQRDAGARRVLTTHAALVLEVPEDPTGVLLQYSHYYPAALEGVPGGYVIEGLDPWGAVQVAEELRAREGVKTAYPLLKRRQYVR